MRKLVSISLLIFGIAAKAHSTAEQATEAYFITIKNQPKQLDVFLKTMPKGGDLHTHLSGAALAENMLHYAKNDSCCIHPQSLVVYEQTDCRPTYRIKNLADYPNVYNATIDAWSMRHFHADKESGHDHFFAAFAKYSIISKKHVSEIITEVIKRAYEQNALYLELMLTLDNNVSGHQLGKQVVWNPNLAVLRKKLLNPDLSRVVSNMSMRLDSYEKITSGNDFKLRYLYQVQREQPPTHVFAQLLAGFELASKDSRVLGINLVQPEDGKIALRDYSLQMQMIAFLHIVYPKVHISLHAGELTSTLVSARDLGFHIRQAVEVAKANRIGHGVAIRQETNSTALLKEMAKKHILVEINLSSNEAILGVTGQAHPLLLYMHYKVPVALSTDDEGVLRTNLTEQYKKAVLNYGLSYVTLKKLARNSIYYSFLPGKSLWKDDQYLRVQSVCNDSFYNGTSFPSQFTISSACQNFLKANEKASLQWKLEKQFSVFEKNVAQAKK